MSDELNVIEREFKRARSKALRNFALSLTVFVMLLVLSGTGSKTLTIILLALNGLGAFGAARRAIQLWPTGRVMTALRDRPQDIASVHQWPAKLPQGHQPFALEIRTRSGALAKVPLDRKHAGEAAALVAALRVRAPDAVVVYPSVNVA